MATSTDDIRFFDRVARLGSLTAVARDLGLSLAAVSKRLSALEQRLGVQLVHRTTRRLNLTPEGELYLAGGRPIVTQLEDLESGLGNRTPILQGRLNVNASFGFGRRYIAPLVSRFAAHHPGLEISLRLTSQPISMLDAGIDVDIRIGKPPDSRLVAHYLLENPRILCASPAYLNRAGMPRTTADLASHNCIVLKQFEGDYAYWRFTKDGQEHAQKVVGTLSSNDGEVALRMALDGHGAILRSRWDVEEHLRSGALIELLHDYQAPRADIYAVYQYRQHVPQRILVFTRYLAGAMATRSAQAPVEREMAGKIER